MKLNFNIKTKIFLFFTSCLVIVFTTFFFYINYVIKPKDIEYTMFDISQIVESTSSEVGVWVNKKALEYRIISAIPAFISMDTREITSIVNHFTNLYMRNGEAVEIFSYIGRNSFYWINGETIESLIDYNDYRLAYSSEQEFIIGSPVVNKNNKEVMLFYYPVLGYNNEKEALIFSAVPTTGLKEIINTTEIYNGKTWVMRRDYELLTTDNDYFFSNYIAEDTLKLIDTNVIKTSGSIPVIDVKGNPSTLFFSPVPYYKDWITCTLVRNKELTRSADELIVGCVFIFILLLIITGFLGFFLAHSVMKPIRRLQSCMNKVEDGNLNVYYDTNTSRDEIYELGVSYNKMLDEIAKLIDRIYQEENEKRIAELAVLQAQIKPHFLYNTLDNLKWMAKEQGAEEIARTITSLSSFFRIFLSNGQEEITIADEFKRTKCYLDIQAVRYKDKLSYSIYLEEGIRLIKTVKIIVQPLVENAIYHGIKPKGGLGHISIKGVRAGEFIRITVTDNGIGMDENSLATLIHRIESMDSTEHFGMVNTLIRLKAAYGDNACIEVKSKKSEGTTVTIKIPIKEALKDV